MEPLSIMGAIMKVAQQIAKAASTARQNRRRCLELADRLRTIGDLLRDSKAAKDMDTRKVVLDRLRDALADALELVESCQSVGLFSMFLAAGRNAGRFANVERRINNCLMDLGIANDARLEKQVNQLAARGNHPGTNAKAGSKKKKKKINRNAKKNDVAMNGNKSSAAAGRYKRNKGHAGGKKGKQMKEKAATALPAPRTGAVGMYLPPPQHHQQGAGVPYYTPYVSVEEDPNSCSVMRSDPRAQQGSLYDPRIHLRPRRSSCSIHLLRRRWRRHRKNRGAVS